MRSTPPNGAPAIDLRSGPRAPYAGSESYLFVSYAREDRGRVQPLIERLLEAGVRLWWDDGLTAGQSFAEEIEKRVHSSAGVIVFLSANSTTRKAQNWVYQETHLAAANGKDVIPVRLDSSTLPLDWKALVEHRQMLQASDRHSLERAPRELIERAKALGCAGEHIEETGHMQSNHPGFAGQNAIITLLCVAVAVLLTIVFMRSDAKHAAMDEPRSGGIMSERPPTPSSPFSERTTAAAPGIPAGYVDSIADEVRNWVWSKQSGAFNAELTLHWENCQGVENMKASNKMSQSGTIASIASRYGLPVRCCRFCYAIEFDRRMKNGGITDPAETNAR